MALALGSLAASLSFSLFTKVPQLNLIVIFCILILLFALFIIKKWQIHWIFVSALGVSCVLISGTWLATNRLHLDSAIFAEHNSLLGQVDSIPRYSSQHVQFDFQIKKYCPNDADCISAKARVSLILPNPSFSLKKGDSLQLTAKLKKPYNYANPGSIDQERQSFLKNIQAHGRVVKIEKLKSTESYSLRALLLNHLKNKYADSALQGIILALLVGDQSLVTKKQWGVFRHTGTSHLMAISGLHIGLMASFAFFCCFHLWNRTQWAARFSTQSIAAIGAIISSLLYSYLAGWSIPTQRACIMVFLCMLSMLTRHWLSRMQILCIALWVVLMLDPFASLRAGFWLSFFAVGILLLYSWIQSHSAWKKWIVPQLWVFVGLIPLSLFWFAEVSLWSPIVNLLAIPWMSFVVVPCLFLDTLLSTIAQLDLSYFVEATLTVLWKFLTFFSQMPGAALPLNFHWSALCLCMLGALLLVLPNFRHKILSIFCFIPLFCGTPTSLKQGEMKLTVLDVGQGTAVVMQTKNHTILYDTGPKYKDFSAGSFIIDPFLRAQNIKQIDLMIISHNDMDHRGGLDALLEKRQFPILTANPQLLSAPASTCRAHQSFEKDGFVFTFLHPVDPLPLKINNQSCVLKVSNGFVSVLIPGDIEAQIEKDLIKKHQQLLEADILIVPHHGSKTSSSMAFIETVKPRYAIIPVGKDNRYGHPRPHILERYQKFGSVVFNTAQSGAISFLIKDTLQAPEEWRKTTRHFWNS